MIRCNPKLLPFSVCNATIPQISDGTVNTTVSDLAPYFFDEIVRYQSNANFSATDANLANVCARSTMMMESCIYGQEVKKV